MRLIDADNLIDALLRHPQTKDPFVLYSFGLCAKILESAPTANGVVVPHGNWIDLEPSDWPYVCKCSHCGEANDGHTPYCPYCGAYIDNLPRTPQE